MNELGRERGPRLPAMLLESVLRTVHDVVLVTEAEPITQEAGGPRVVYVNAAFTAMTGYTADEIVGRTPRILQSADTDRAELDRLRAALARWEPAEVELLNRRKDGTLFWVQLSVTPLADESGRFTHWVSIQRDTTGRKERELGLLSHLHEGQRALHTAEQRFRSAFDDAPFGTAITTPVGRIVQANPALCALVGRAADELAAGSLFDITHREDLAQARAACERLRSRAAGVSECEVRLLHADGRVLHARVSASLVLAPNETPSHVIMHIEDVTDRRALQAQLTHQALHDPLTGLPNRALFTDRLAQALARTERDPAKLAVLFLDLDRFKVVNDSLGHAAGDQALMTIARRLDQLLRPGDTAARFGGDEFVLLCVDVDAADIAKRVGAAVAEPIALSGPVVLTASIGGVVSAGGEQPDRLIADADAAMYQAKQGGRARYEVFDESLRSRALARLATETALRTGIECGQLRLHFQPEVALDGRQIIGMEALVRWEHPERGLLTPAAFIDLAEETGLIEPLGRWVLQEACRQQARWRDQGITRAVMWVNLSVHQLTDPTLPATVAEALRTAGLTGSDLGLEITESVLMHNLEHTTTALDALHELGVHLAIDDFGTGYSSLAYLQRFPIDTLKIDRSFVAGLDDARLRQESHAIVAAVIGLAHTLNLRVVAEGVETESQLQRLHDLHCDTAQGFYFSAPRPADTALRRNSTTGFQPNWTITTPGNRPRPMASAPRGPLLC